MFPLIVFVPFQQLEHTIRLEDVMISYLPLAHMFERCCQSALYMVGGSVVFFSGDIKALSNDMKIAQPTLLPGKCFCFVLFLF